MLRKQLLVLLGMLAAVLVILVAWQRGLVLSNVELPLDDPADRLAFVLRWLALPGAALLVGIGMVANRRFFTADAIDGNTATVSRSLQVNLRYNKNTLEQAVLVALAWPALALVLPQQQLAIIPVLAVFFVFGRAAFWIGYLAAPWARAFGFALTFYPTVAAYLWLLARLLR